MRVIYKTTFEIDRETVYIPMQENASILDIQLQDRVPTLWFECDPAADISGRLLEIVGTGNGPRDGRYIATLQLDGFVWHIYDGWYTDPIKERIYES